MRITVNLLRPTCQRNAAMIGPEAAWASADLAICSP
jgi:hypothetical protein